MTKSEAAKKIDCHKSHYGRMESGHTIPSPSMARKIAQVFAGDITEQQLLYPGDYIAEAPKRRKAA